MKKNEIFKFKEFEVSHKVNAQKVSTDSVLLGAWADLLDAHYVLDIGTGCGVLALMAAQRNPNAKIDAVEIIPEFAFEAKTNFKRSKFDSRIKLIQTDIRKFPRKNQYDHIIVNPPYFSNSLQSTNPSKNNARHDLNLSFEDLAEAASDLLSENGKISIVVPFQKADYLQGCFRQFGMQCYRMSSLKHTKDSSVSIRLMEFGSMHKPFTESEIIIKEGENYSETYSNLLKGFLTIF